MRSLTKNKQNRTTIEKMVNKIFPGDSLTAYVELTEGYFNVAYEVQLKSCKPVILKVAPNRNTRIMTYEKNIMKSEVEAMKRVEECETIPAPKVLGYDESCTICESPYFFMEKLEGCSLNSIKENLSKEEIDQIYMETGKICREINEIECPHFGYPGQPEYQGDDWFTVFRKMLEAGVEDARKGNVDIKISIDELWKYLERDRDIFCEVVKPQLVHWDCWDGNIFVKDKKITGLIDWER